MVRGLVIDLGLAGIGGTTLGDEFQRYPRVIVILPLRPKVWIATPKAFDFAG
jgi:hypothetical protein